MQLLNAKHDADSDGEDAATDGVRAATAQQSQQAGSSASASSSSPDGTSSSSSSPDSTGSSGTSGSGSAHAGTSADGSTAPQSPAAKPAFTEAPAPFSAAQHAIRFNAEPQEVAPEYAHLQRELGLHLTKLKVTRRPCAPAK